MIARLVRTSFIVTVLSLAGQGLAFLLQVFLAAVFGAGAATDAYLAAATLPTLVNTVFLMAMNITFIPVFIEYETKANSAEAWRVANSFSAIVLGVLAVVSLTGSLFSESLILMIAPGLAQDAGTLALAAGLQRILLPAMVLMAWAGLLGGLFYAHQSFVIPTLGPMLCNGVVLLVAWVLLRPAGIYGVAIGVVVGNAVQVLLLLALLYRQFRPRLQLAFNHPGVRQIGRLMLPWLLAAMIYKANPVVDRIVASQFPAGAISILGYAYMLAQLAVFASSRGASLAVFPAMSRLMSAGQREQLPGLMDAGLRLVLAVVVPVVLLLLLLGDAIVAVVYQRGTFSTADVQQTSLALAGYAGSIIALSVGNILTYVYYALQDTKTPAVVGILGMGVNLALALLLRQWLGFLSPAVSYSVMSLLNLLLLSVILRRRLGRLVQASFLPFCGQMMLAGLVMVLVVLATGRTLPHLPAVAQIPLLQLVYQGTAGVLGYGLLWVLSHRRQVGRVLHGGAGRGLLPARRDP